MDVVSMARELGKLIQQDERYGAYVKAKELNDKDEELQRLIHEFEAKRYELNMEMSKTDKDADKLKELDGVIKNVYGEIMVNPSMAAFNKAKNAMDGMLAEINNVITASANGEDPETCPSQPSGCSGSCSTCGGCH
ncbi:MAG: YlbF family regulator [Clostridium sp.]|nr:YlbF family regulator [Clostridium sp.]MCM1547587.1 YlbF family regulator [Ruminococcus sp.]